MAGSNATKGVLSELAKRVPKNQTKQFKAFLDLNKKYTSRVNKNPEKLPVIDWDYYRTNVRIEAVKMVDEFEKKYEELNKVFDERNKLDTKKYYDELEKQRTVVQEEVKQYIVESNKRIKAYEAEILRLCTMKPYSSMTIEEFITTRPECSTYIPFGGKPLFWPHDPDEQKPGPVGIPGVGDDDKKGGGGDDSSGGAGGPPITPSDIEGKTEKFEFTPVDPKETPKKAEVKAVSAPKLVDEKPPPVVESKPESSSKEVPEPQIHIDKPASAETKKKLDPCNLEDKFKQQIDAKALPKEHEAADEAEAKTDAKAEVKSEADIKAAAPLVGNKSGPQKAPHPCDLVKKVMKKEHTVKEVDPCKNAPKGPYKDEKGNTCAFLDPCKSKFGAGIKSHPQTVEQGPAKEKTAAKSATKESPKEPESPEKPSVCDMVLKKKEKSDKGPCEKSAKKTNIKSPYKDEKGSTCVFLDPCKSKFGAGIKSDSKTVEQGPAKEKTAAKSATKEAPKEPEKPSVCDNVLKKKEKSDKDPCEISAKKTTSKGEKPVIFNPCKAVTKKAAKTEKALKKETTAKTEKAVKPMKAVETEKSIGKESKPKPDTKTTSTCESSAPKEAKVATKPAEVTKKPKVEANIVKDKNSCTMVFGDPPKADKKPQEDQKKASDSCAPTPYYNPFRSDDENRKKEEETCDDECEESDYCKEEERREDKDYYNPCKDDKEKK